MEKPHHKDGKHDAQDGSNDEDDKWSQKKTS